MKAKQKWIQKVTTVFAVFALLMSSIFTPITLLANENAGNGSVEEQSLRAADITKPVIEDVSFPDNGKDIEAGSNVPINVTAYDSESGIKMVRANYRYINDKGEIDKWDSIDLEKVEGDNLYKGELIAPLKGYTKAEITSIEVVDEQSNRVTYWTENFYINIINSGVVERGTIEKISFPKNGQVLSRGEKVDLEATVASKDVDRINELIFEFLNQDQEYHDSVRFNLYKENGKFVNMYDSIPSHISGGRYVLSNIYAYESDGNVTDYNSKINFDFPEEEFSFKVEEKVDSVIPVITDIKMSVEKGSMLSAGDKVKFTITANDDVALSEEYASLHLQSISDIHDGSKRVSLNYMGENVFEGEFEVTNDTYPCEWYLSYVDIRDSSNNATDVYQYNRNFTDDFYFNVTKEGTFVNPTIDVEISFSAIGENGYQTRIGEWSKDDVERRTTFKEAGVKFPEVPNVIEGLKFVEWQDSNGNVYDDNSQIKDSNYLSLYAVYDKAVVTAYYEYIDNNLGNFGYKNKTVLFPQGTTKKAAIEELKKETFSDQYTDKEYSWEFSYNNNEPDDNEVLERMNNYSFRTKYKGYDIVSRTTDYYDEAGRMVFDRKAELVNEGMKVKEYLNKLEQAEAPKMFKDLRFNKWVYNYYDSSSSLEEDDEISNFTYFNKSAQHENYIIRFLLDDTFRNQGKIAEKGAGAGGVLDETKIEYIYAFVAEKGDTIKVPEIPGYKNIKWVYPEKIEDSYVVQYDMTFMGYGDKVDEPSTPDTPTNPDKPETPDTPANPDKPVSPDTPTNPSKPEIKPSEDNIKEVVSEITEAKTGDIVEVKMGEANVLPVEYLESAKGKDITIKLEMNGYSWTINGKDINASNLKDINMEVVFDTDAIPSKVVQSLAGDNPVKKLSLTHNGDFGFKANLTVNVGNEYQGKFGNLYYYDSDGKMVFMNAGAIDGNGNVSLGFSHASEYVIVIKDKADTANFNSNSVETGDTNNAAMWMLTLVISSGAIVYLLKTKRKEER